MFDNSDDPVEMQEKDKCCNKCLRERVFWVEKKKKLGQYYFSLFQKYTFINLLLELID